MFTGGSRRPSTSRTPSQSRPGTRRSSPSSQVRALLVLPPPLRPTLSLSSLHAPGRSSAPGTPWPSANMSALPPHLSQPGTVPASSASSVVNVDLSEGILVRDAEVETDIADGEAVGHMDPPAADEESKKNLRDQLRRTLSRKESSTDLTLRPRRRKLGKAVDIDELEHDAVDKYPPRQYFVLTDAGKPVFTTRPDEDSEDVTSAMGIMQALISIFLDDNDKLRCINAGSTRITFLLRPPLYHVCVSSWREPESVTRTHLEYLHLQILSIVSAAQLRRIFERRTNFDLRRLLNGAENLLDSLLARMESDLAVSTSSLLCLKLEPSLRSRTADALVPSSKMQDILYILLVARGRVITLVRPKKHSIHPADLHILLNTIHAPSVFDSSASASWLPICLPKYNPAGFLHAYVSFLRNDSIRSDVAAGGTVVDDDDDADGSGGKLGLGLVCVSGGGGGDFESIRCWCDSIAKKLESDGTLGAITHAVRTGATEYSAATLGIPGLRHFVYKSRAHVQVTLPVFEELYADLQERRRLITLYQTLYDSIHAKSGQEGTLKLQYIRTEKESVMGWITQPFELYIALSPRLPKSAVVGAANAVARWVKKEEAKLFLRDAPVF